MTFASTGVQFPEGLAFDKSGNLYVANDRTDTIEKFTPGGVGSVFATTGFSPTGLAFDAAGNLYVANQHDNTIEEFAPDGVASVFATTATTPMFLAFAPSAVPEPLSLVLMVLGALGPIAYLARHRPASPARR